MKKSKSFLLCRFQSPYLKASSPIAFVNGYVEINEKGEQKFVAQDPVAISMASDFTPVSNSIYRSGDIVSPVRDVIDPVDTAEKYPEVFNL